MLCSGHFTLSVAHTSLTPAASRNKNPHCKVMNAKGSENTSRSKAGHSWIVTREHHQLCRHLLVDECTECALCAMRLLCAVYYEVGVLAIFMGGKESQGLA